MEVLVLLSIRCINQKGSKVDHEIKGWIYPAREEKISLAR